MVFGKGFKRKKSGTAQKRKGGQSYTNWQAARAQLQEPGDGDDIPNGDGTLIDSDVVGVAEEVGNVQDTVPDAAAAKKARKDDGWRTSRAVKAMSNKLAKEKEKYSKLKKQNVSLQKKHGLLNLRLVKRNTT